MAREVTDRRALRPAKAAEWWIVESQRPVGQRFEEEPDRFASRRQALRAAKRHAAATGRVCRVVRVLEVRFSGEKDRVYEPRQRSGEPRSWL